MFKKIEFLLLFSLMAFSLSAQKNNCSTPPNPGNPGGDSPDDNASYSTGNTNGALTGKGNLYIFNSGNKNDSRVFFSQFAENVLFVDVGGDSKIPFIVFPTGSLYGKENDSTLKNVIEQHVRLGGTIIVFAQQYGDGIDKIVPIPEESSLKSYGWREDQGCVYGAMGLENMHPILTGQTRTHPHLGLDGYFSVYPSSSTVILRKFSTHEPTLLYYPFGNGTVILTSMYSDYGYAHGQASREELKLVRDLITFAKNPKSPIPMFDLNDNASPEINLNAAVKNETETAAAKVRVKVLTPSREAVLFETETAASINPGEEASVPIQFTLPALTPDQYGICHTEKSRAGRPAVFSSYNLFPVGGQTYQYGKGNV